MSKREAKSAGNPVVRAVILSVALGVAVLLLLAAVGGMLILKGILPESAMDVWAMAMVFLAAFLAPMPLLKTTGKKRLPMAYAVLAALLALMVVTKWLAWPQEPFSNLWPLVTGFAGATLAGVLGAKKPKRKKY